MEEIQSRKIPRIGKGKNMSLAKAGLIVWFEKNNEGCESFDRGLPDIMHRIVDVAGAKNISFFTSQQVTNCLANSPYWDKRLVIGMYKGIGRTSAGRGRGDALLYKPSEKGIEYYKKHLKQRLKSISPPKAKAMGIRNGKTI